MANPMNKWRIDLSGGSGQRSVSRTHDGSLNPPGYVASFSQSSQHVERNQQDQQQQQHLMSSSSTDQISAHEYAYDVHVRKHHIDIPNNDDCHDGWRPVKAIMSVNAAFKPLEAEYSGNLILHKIIFAIGNLAGIALAVYKCHTMGLLPNHASDWLDFVPPAERMQFVFTGDSFI